MKIHNETMVIRKSLATQVVDILEREIVEGVYQPDGHLREAELAKRFKVSRASIREALQTLASRGFLINIPHHGMFVAPIGAEEVEEIFFIRAHLESLAIAEAIRQQEPGVIEKLEKLRLEMEEAAKDPDRERYYNLNMEFHEIFHNASGKKMLAEMVNNFSKQTQRYRREYFSTEAQMARSLESHAKLVKFFKSGQADEAYRYRKQRLLENSRHLQSKIKKESKDQSNSPPYTTREIQGALV